MMGKEIVCIVCPNSCVMHVERSDNCIKVSGNKCPKGKSFAENELTAPVRMLCTTVPTAFKGQPVLSVRLSAEIPKDMLFEAMKEINKISVASPVKCGDVILKNLLGLGADVLATSDLTPDE